MFCHIWLGCMDPATGNTANENRATNCDETQVSAVCNANITAEGLHLLTFDSDTQQTIKGFCLSLLLNIRRPMFCSTSHTN